MRGPAAITLVLAVGLTACRQDAGARITSLPRVIAEPSGAVASRAHPGVTWVHGDSGTSAAAFGVRARADGRMDVVSRLDLNVPNVDWEDVARRDTPRPELWIGDIGNNSQDRQDLVVHVVAEPETLTGPVDAKVLRSVRFRYPDQDGEPNWDAESLFFHDDTLWLLTKHRADTHTTVYRFGDLADEHTADVVLQRVASFDLGGARLRFGGRASGATTSPDGAHLAVLSYHALFIFDLRPGAHPLMHLRRQIDLDMARLQQCEAIAWDADGVLIINEARRLFRVGDPLAPGLTRFPG